MYHTTTKLHSICTLYSKCWAADQHLPSCQGGPARAWILKLIIHLPMRMHCTIQSMETTPSCQNKAPLFHRLHLTAPVLACAPACLATGARRVSIRRLGCGQHPASLRLGCQPQYRLCLLECLHPAQVVRDWYQTAEDHIQHYIRLAPVCECKVYSAILQETWRNAPNGKAHLFVMLSLER